MTFLSQIWHWCWFTSTGFYVVVLALLARRRLFREVPVFTALVSCEIAGSSVLIWMNYAPTITADQYWSAFALVSALKAALSFAVFCEVLRRVFQGYSALTELSTQLFRWATIILAFVAIALAWLAPATGEGHLMATFYMLARTFGTVLCGLLMLLFIFSKSLGLSWRSYIFGIALGVAVMVCGNLAATAIRSQVEPIARNLTTDVLDLISESANLGGVIVWIAYMLAYERERLTPVRTLRSHDLETWNQELQRLLHQ